MKVIKRNGDIENFNTDKIASAVRKAMVKTGEVLEGNILPTSISIANRVYEAILDYTDDFIGIEDIQNEVEDMIMKAGFTKTAKEYILYRNERTRLRNQHPLDKSITGLLNLTNEEVMRENANKQSTLESTKRDLIAGEISKYIVRTQILPKKPIEAHDKGIIHIHDMDYGAQHLTNCELVPLDRLFKEGTVINKKLIRTPKSLRTASTLATQIAAQISSFTYGGQTMSLSHLAPYVRVSKEKITKKYESMNLPIPDLYLKNLIEKELKTEIKDSVQTFNYQLNTLNSTNGQSPFLSLAMYINEDPEYEEETAMLIEEFLKQRIEGIENEFGVKATQTFPKLLFFLDEDNMYPDSKYYYLKQLAIKSTSLRMNPDFISAKRMKEIYGHVFPPMGCRSFLSPWYDENGNVQFYGRGNVGVCTINLPYIALLSGKDEDKFWKELDKYLDMCKQIGIWRFKKLKGVKASCAPILWQHGVFSRLNPDDEIYDVVKNKFTVSLGYAGIYETVKYMKNTSHTTEKGFEFADKIMTYLQNKAAQWKEETGYLFAVYGTPAESTAGVFCEKIKAEFGEIKDITDKGFITNSYHVDVREPIDAFNKLNIESKLQEHSTGGAVSYIETYNMNKNLKAIEQVVDYIYDKMIYAEINFESDVCGKCNYNGAMEYNIKENKWICPQCQNDDQNKLSVVRRVCGYLGENQFSNGRVLDILNRVKHL